MSPWNRSDRRSEGLQGTDAVDALIRRSLEPEEGAAERIVTRSLVGEKERQASLLGGPAVRWALAGVAALVAAVLLVGRGAREPTRPEALAGGLQGIEVRAEEVSPYRVSSTGGVVTVTAPSGRILSIIAGGVS